MVRNRQSAAVISEWTEGMKLRSGEQRVRDKHTDSPDSSCSISASESLPPSTWRLDISGEREKRKRVGGAERERKRKIERDGEKGDEEVRKRTTTRRCSFVHRSFYSLYPIIGARNS